MATIQADARSERKDPATGTNGHPGTSRLDAVRSTAADAAATAGTLVNEATMRLPGTVAATRDAFDDASRRIHTSSDEMLRLGTAVSFGFVAGLVLAGASRILVVLAMVPVGMFGLAWLERSSGSQVQAR